MPDCAAQPACSRLVQAPSARYSMMPDAIEPTVPSASTICRGVEFKRRADARGRAHGAEHRGRMKSGFVRERRRHRD